MIKITDEDGDNSPQIKSFLMDNSKLKPSSDEDDSCSHSPEKRKRGYSDVDQINFNSLKLNIKASLQKVCDNKIKEIK